MSGLTMLRPGLVAMLKRMDGAELVAAAPSATLIVKAIGTQDHVEMALGGAHKIRVRFPQNFTDAEVAESHAWLKQHGLRT